MPNYTPNYNLYLPSRLDETIEVDTSLSDNFTKIDTEIKNRENEIGDLTTLTTTAKNDLVSAINEHDGEIGDLSTLTTSSKSTLVSAINEHDNEIGDLSTLNTTVKSTLAAAINEVKGKADTNETNIGTLTNLTTTNKNNLVDAVNEVQGKVNTNTSNIGTLSNLTTTDKTNLVNAINEVNNKVSGVVKGTFTTSGDGEVTTVNITHRLGVTPTFYQVQAGSADAGTAEISYITADATNITVTFKNALPSGTDNIVLIWKVEK